MAYASYISAAANRFSHVADTSAENLVAFGASKFVALWSVDWIKVCAIKAHSKPVSAITIFGNIVATGASDSVVKLWDIRQKDEDVFLEERQAISLGKRYPLSLALGELPQASVIILAIGGTDSNVQLWLRSEDTFVRSATLAGHEDWVRGLDFHQGDSEQPLVLASGSQDGNIRLWNIEPLTSNQSPADPPPGGELADELLDAFEASLGEVGEGEEGGKQISLKRHVLSTKSASGQYSVTFDALLVGHEAGITSLKWRPNSQASTVALLSTSTDSSVILWTPSSSLTQIKNGPSLWVNYQRFGDVGGQRLGGFVGGIWGSTGNDLLAWGWSGGWRRWKCTDSSKGASSEVWNEVGAISGHSGPVKGLDWSPNGDYLISTGVDQTTRIHGGIPASESSANASWHELGRPQIHGYDLLNVVFIDRLKFASIADEKVLRVFEAPRSFVEVLEHLKVSNFSNEEHSRPAGASVPALGLSNKAVGEGTSQALAITELDVTRRPFEGELASSTLWPEVEKVFGHGYESITLGISNSRKYIATACKATSAEHAVVRVYDTTSFRPFGQPLVGHALTVTRIAFSPGDKLVLTVSRDRTWRLFGLQEDSEGFEPVAADKSHGRIIWDCAWSPDGSYFVTASRDKTVRVWRRTGEDNKTWAAVQTLKNPEAATAVAISTTGSQLKTRLAVGLENGNILIYTAPPDITKEWKHDLTIDSK
ncbi:hypothetical protein EST38_g579 [Candolleomyces aberdarensis]|uniref:Elongator complex protein 2 n=1 Tax=Candolleomyces aberdarensis TaxID=2316362 RepID=A0A4Q2DY68_9AGAR|nr:hypothetical protein EST38_g579 [Candolleomyces aberdarensis]